MRCNALLLVATMAEVGAARHGRHAGERDTHGGEGGRVARGGQGLDGEAGVNGHLLKVGAVPSATSPAANAAAGASAVWATIRPVSPAATNGLHAKFGSFIFSGSFTCFG